MNTGAYITIAFVLVVVFTLFLLLREFWCWYFKINPIKELLTSIDKSLQKISGIPILKGTKCHSCGAALIEGKKTCPSCGAEVT